MPLTPEEKDRWESSEKDEKASPMATEQSYCSTSTRGKKDGSWIAELTEMWAIVRARTSRPTAATLVS